MNELIHHVLSVTIIPFLLCVDEVELNEKEEAERTPNTTVMSVNQLAQM
jgi:hypothetical protein